ncbi:methionine sulfoxide reductase a [Leptolyngbya sp. Heron Island J]|uniref:peptide-methionine (S)-S-oxide reductase MsrA n=1 Tax=Leptolyngbya sp. Heron Island J TaxID=1385935 RepID=UPI0003B9467C|nr:peptide-methionine (S)-S-oxide reductase MsrA [Leptolyngbya sp. Heron Island J]ESA38599.1 methionine sulfoxide reductase a [Leptolyngbya sp. Heron Island J]
MVASATFGAGCFWGTEHAFRQLSGVVKTSVGYMGGHFENPCYLDVLSRITGHAEVAQIHYDPATISYETLLDRFWQIHDPTSLNRQGADRGEQYRSVIFYHTDEQRQLAHRAKQAMASQYPQPIVTEIVVATQYWLASEEHQQYFEKKSLKRHSKQYLS